MVVGIHLRSGQRDAIRLNANNRREKASVSCFADKLVAFCAFIGALFLSSASAWRTSFLLIASVRMSTDARRSIGISVRIQKSECMSAPTERAAGSLCSVYCSLFH